MSAAALTETLTLFGDLDENLWGVAVGDSPGRWIVARFDGGPLATVEPPSVSTIPATSATEGGGDVLELVEVHARFSDGAMAGDEAREARLPGVRLAAVSTGKLASLRVLGAWFPEGRQLGLSALRPPGARGQDRDQIEAVATGEPLEKVVDPRLSTTSDRDGALLRVGAELWLEHEGDDEGDDGQRPRRLAGEVTGAALSSAQGDFRLDAYALRCWTDELAGSGVCVVLRAS